MAREITSIGRKGKSFLTEAGREKLIKMNKGKEISRKQRDKLSEIGKSRVGERNPFFGKNHSNETIKMISDMQKRRFSDVNNHPRFNTITTNSTKEKISNKLKGRVITKESIKLSEENKLKRVMGPDGKVYNSITEAAKYTHHDRATVSRWLKNNRVDRGFSWV